ncbi:MAG: DUF2892 domain-containing protein [Ghiorsea sp.]
MFDNVGTVDRTIRVVLGVALTSAGLLGSGVGSMIIMIVGLVSLATGLTSSCPIYKAIGKSTCEVEDPRGH